MTKAILLSAHVGLQYFAYYNRTLHVLFQRPQTALLRHQRRQNMQKTVYYTFFVRGTLE